MKILPGTQRIVLRIKWENTFNRHGTECPILPLRSFPRKAVESFLRGNSSSSCKVWRGTDTPPAALAILPLPPPAPGGASPQPHSQFWADCFCVRRPCQSLITLLIRKSTLLSSVLSAIIPMFACSALNAAYVYFPRQHCKEGGRVRK